jgi:hypothetical protein
MTANVMLSAGGVGSTVALGIAWVGDVSVAGGEAGGEEGLAGRGVGDGAVGEKGVTVGEIGVLDLGGASGVEVVPHPLNRLVDRIIAIVNRIAFLGFIGRLM